MNQNKYLYIYERISKYINLKDKNIAIQMKIAMKKTQIANNIDFENISQSELDKRIDDFIQILRIYLDILIISKD